MACSTDAVSWQVRICSCSAGHARRGPTDDHARCKRLSPSGSRVPRCAERAARPKEEAGSINGHAGWIRGSAGGCELMPSASGRIRLWGADEGSCIFHCSFHKPVCCAGLDAAPPRPQRLRLATRRGGQAAHEPHVSYLYMHFFSLVNLVYCPRAIGPCVWAINMNILRQGAWAIKLSV